MEVQASDMLIAKRGHIYEFDDGKNPIKRYVLVISSDTRACDTLVNIIMLGDSPRGHDVVMIDDPNFETVKYLHCGMVTYTRRDYLVKEICTVSPEIMEEIEEKISVEFSILKNVKEMATFYKTAYNELLEKVIDKISME